MSAFYVVAYASLSVPAIIAGLLTTTPLGLDATFEIFGSVIAGVALLVAALAWRTRPPTALTASDAVTATARPASTRAHLRTCYISAAIASERRDRTAPARP